jgi:hypothetical protein
MMMEDAQCSAALRSLLPLAAQAARASPLAAELSQQLQALLGEQEAQQRGAAAAADAAARGRRQEAEELQQEEEDAAATPLTKLAGRLAHQGQAQGSGLTPLAKGMTSMGLATPPAKPKAGSPGGGRRSPGGDAAGQAPGSGGGRAAAAAAAASGAGLLSPVRQGLEKLGAPRRCLAAWLPGCCLAAAWLLPGCCLAAAGVVCRCSSRAPGAALLGPRRSPWPAPPPQACTSRGSTSPGAAAGVAAPKTGRVQSKAERMRLINEAAAQAGRAAKGRQQQGVGAGAAPGGGAGGAGGVQDLAARACKALAAALLACLARQPFGMPGGCASAHDAAPAGRRRRS